MKEAINKDEFSDILCDMDKIETVIKVLNQTLFEDKDFNIQDSQNLCSLLYEKFCKTKSKLTKFEDDFT